VIWGYKITLVFGCQACRKLCSVSGRRLGNTKTASLIIPTYRTPEYFSDESRGHPGLQMKYTVALAFCFKQWPAQITCLIKRRQKILPELVKTFLLKEDNFGGKSLTCLLLF